MRRLRSEGSLKESFNIVKTISRANPLDVLSVGMSLSNVFLGSFKDSKSKAKTSGKLLGLTLALRLPFVSQSISLIGFSLGTQVIKSCLKTLHVLGATDLIHKVTFMGGAINRLDRDKSREQWSTILSQIIPGEIKNVYTKKDLVLLLYSASEQGKSTGRNNIFPEPFLGAKRTNLLAEGGQNTKNKLPAIASPGDLAFSLRNFNIWSLDSD